MYTFVRVFFCHEYTLLVFFELRTVQYVYSTTLYLRTKVPSKVEDCLKLFYLHTLLIMCVHVAYCTCIEYESTKVLPYESIYFLTYLRTYEDISPGSSL